MKRKTAVTPRLSSADGFWCRPHPYFSVCKLATRKFFHIPKGVKDIYLQVSTSPKPEAVPFYFHSSYRDVGYWSEIRAGKWELLTTSFAEWLFSQFQLSSTSTKLYVRVLYD